tara:strand:- start:738 stop:3281 length:2544 start_codon:yes stop_codon:yes gene_type:complete
MGTYRQPSQVIDKSLSVANQGMQNTATQMERGLARRRQQQLLDAKEIQRKNELKNKDLKVFNQRKNASIDGYKEKMASWEHINQGSEGQEIEGVSIENQLKDNAKYYLDIMSGSVEGDERYRNAELAIRNMITEYPLMAEMLNKEAQQANNAYLQGTNEQRNSNEPDAFLISEDPLSGTKKSMLRNLNGGTNALRYNVQTGPNGVNLIYTDSDGKEVTVNAKRYKTEKENGYNLVETTDAKAQKVFMDGVWSVVGKGYEGEGELKTTYTAFKEKGESLTETDKILHFSKANAEVEKQVSRWVEDNQGEVTQSQWQLLGGEGIFNRERDKGKLVELLTKAQIDNNGIPGSKLISSSSVEKRLPGTSDESKLTLAARSELNTLGGVFDKVNTTVNKAFEMDKGGRVKAVKESINKNLPESANYAYLDFTQVKTQIEKERKKAVEAGNSEEVARLDELKKEYKLDQAPNKDLLYKKTFTKGKIQLDKPFDSSDKDKVLRTLAKERGITTEEAFEVFKSQRTNVKNTNTFDPQNFQKPLVSTGAGGSNISQGSGSVANVPQPVANAPQPVGNATQPVGNATQPVGNAQTTPPSNEYGDNVKIDPATNVVSFDFNGKTVDSSKATKGFPVMKMKNDNNDYIRKMGNFETLAGNSKGGGVSGYGFSGANPGLSKLFKNAKGNNAEDRFINSVNDYIIGQDGGDAKYGGKNTILTDLGISRAEYDKLPKGVKKELVDWKFNTGRGTTDVILIAAGGDWDGDRGFRSNSPKASDLKINDNGKMVNINIADLNVKKLKEARNKLYKGRIDGIKADLKSGKYKPGEKPSSANGPSDPTYKEILEFAEDGYNNSQQYR